MIRSPALPLLILAAVLTGCPVGPPAPPLSPVRSITPSKSSLALRVGQQEVVTATVTVVGDASQELVWATLDPEVATVLTFIDGAALVRGVAPGQTTLTGTSVADPGKSLSLPVTVTAVAQTRGPGPSREPGPLAMGSAYLKSARLTFTR